MKSLSDKIARATLSPTLSPTAAAFTVALAVATIAVVDYATGIHISLLFFYLLPVAFSVAWLGKRMAVIVAIAIILIRVTGDWIGYGEQMLPHWYFWNALTSLVVFLIVIWMLDAFLSLQRQLEQRVKDRTAALIESGRVRRQLEDELLAVATRERNAIGHELHDEICQHLVGTALAAQVLVKKLAEEKNPLAPKASAIVSLVEEGANKARQLAHGLLLTEVEPSSLEQKLSDLADDTRQLGATDGIICVFKQSGDTFIHDPGIATQILRIAQEALRNASKHARATNIEICLSGDETAITLTVTDDGCGVDTAVANPSGMGLRVMANRAAFIGATFVIKNRNDGGTEILCRLPKPHGAGAAVDSTVAVAA
ncbi:MAG: hypothetical protein ING75_08970 [Rhodocyclaceae bacterium]|nr:hypothetical protein [Rhodocyclaceae bacterium]